MIYAVLIVLLLILIVCVSNKRAMAGLSEGYSAIQNVLWSDTRVMDHTQFDPKQTASAIVNVNPLSYAIQNTEGYIVRGIDDPREVIVDSEYIPSIQYDEFSGSGNTYGEDPGYKYGPFHDLDPDFNSSRARMGACGGTLPCWSKGHREVVFNAIDSTSLGQRNDDIYDGERCAAMGIYPCTAGTSRTALQTMYKDVMGIDYTNRVSPSEDECEFRSDKGYTYKEQCFQ